jgi:hypothetical protein
MNFTEKWGPVLDHPDLPPIEDSYKRKVTAQLLENQVTEGLKFNGQEHLMPTLLGEASPTNAVVDASGGGQMGSYDPVLISMLRRSAPQMISYDICGVQPMTGPSGLIFAMRSQYATDIPATTKYGAANEASRQETFFNEVDTRFSALANNSIGATLGNSTNTLPFGASAVDIGGNDPSVLATTPGTTAYAVQEAMQTALAEALGDTDANPFSEMAFSIEKVTVEARSRALKAEYTMELAQDMKAVHGLDAEKELANILSTEMLNEINRQTVRTVNIIAKTGAVDNVATSGTFDLDVDANGRWSVERFKGLMFQLEREANAIAKDTRRGKGNIIICSSDVASALQMAGVLDYSSALSNNLKVDDTGNTFVGVLNGRFKVYIDPYFSSSTGLQYANVGYKGSNAYDAGLFYCPYVPLQMVRAIGEQSFQPKIGFKTRYGMVMNPFAKGPTRTTNGQLEVNSNVYYRLMAIKNLM